MKPNIYISTFYPLPFYTKRGNEKGNAGKVAIPSYPYPYLFLTDKVYQFRYIFQSLIAPLPALPHMAYRVLQVFFLKITKENNNV